MRNRRATEPRAPHPSPSNQDGVVFERSYSSPCLYKTPRVVAAAGAHVQDVTVDEVDLLREQPKLRVFGIAVAEPWSTNEVVGTAGKELRSTAGFVMTPQEAFEACDVVAARGIVVSTRVRGNFDQAGDVIWLVSAPRTARPMTSKVAPHEPHSIASDRTSARSSLGHARECRLAARRASAGAKHHNARPLPPSPLQIHDPASVAPHAQSLCATVQARQCQCSHQIHLRWFTSRMKRATIHRRIWVRDTVSTYRRPGTRAMGRSAQR